VLGMEGGEWVAGSEQGEGGGDKTLGCSSNMHPHGARGTWQRGAGAL